MQPSAELGLLPFTWFDFSHEPAMMRELTRDLTQAHRLLAEMKGRAANTENSMLLVEGLYLREARDSSAIENILTTQDELFIADEQEVLSPHQKEVRYYEKAVKYGQEVLNQYGIFRLGNLEAMQAIVKEHHAGVRRVPGTQLVNAATGQVVYTPPQDHQEIMKLLANWLDYFHADLPIEDQADGGQDDLDPLIRMAILHAQFERIHPFLDGNGRMGRIMNLMYLVRAGLLDKPILYMSGYLLANRSKYYQLLAALDERKPETWYNFVRYMIVGIKETAAHGIKTLTDLRQLFDHLTERMKSPELRRIASYDLVVCMMRFPYLRIDLVEKYLDVSRITATKYLDQLAQAAVLDKQRIGRTNYYINRRLVAILGDDPWALTREMVIRTV